MEKKVSFWGKKKKDRFLFELYYEEDILRCGKTQVHKLGYYLYMHKININLFVLEVWCVCKIFRLNM